MMKPKCEKIQQKISIRLNSLKTSIPIEDYQYLWDKTHELYKFTRSLEVDRTPVLLEIRNQEQLSSFAEEFRIFWQKEVGEELDGFSLHWLYDFAIFMAENKNYTFQPTIKPIGNFTPDVK